jgi:hypothetical protein
MADTPIEANYSSEYMDEYHVTLSSFGPTPNLVRKYLRKRFVYSLAEVMRLEVPVPLCYFMTKDDAVGLRITLGRLGAQVKIEHKPGGTDSESYPKLRVPLVHEV